MLFAKLDAPRRICTQLNSLGPAWCCLCASPVCLLFSVAATPHPHTAPTLTCMPQMKAPPPTPSSMPSRLLLCMCIAVPAVAWLNHQTSCQIAVVLCHAESPLLQSLNHSHQHNTIPSFPPAQSTPTGLVEPPARAPGRPVRQSAWTAASQKVCRIDWWLSCGVHSPFEAARLYKQQHEGWQH